MLHTWRAGTVTHPRLSCPRSGAFLILGWSFQLWGWSFNSGVGRFNSGVGAAGTVTQTCHYRAPEVLLGLEWKFPCDMWSVGCILLELLEGEITFDTLFLAQVPPPMENYTYIHTYMYEYI